MIKSLRIGSHVYPVKLIDSNVSFGYSVHADFRSRPRIEINRNADARARMVTLLHEAMHCIFREYGVREFCKTEHGEEGMARLLESAVAQLFIQNPAFGRELIRALTERGK